jgi:uncharacterized protein (DUF427 family)
MTQLPDKDWLRERVGPHRSAWRHARRPARIETPGPGQESVWDFPRPPAVEPVAERLRVEFAGHTVADTTHGRRIIETAGAPVYCFPPEDVATDCLVPNGKVTVCEWKGAATYFDLAVDGRRSPDAAYTYPDPLDDLGQNYASIAGWIVFYASRVDAAYVGEENASPQPGGYYAGWMTQSLTGPVKGEPGSEGW